MARPKRYVEQTHHQGQQLVPLGPVEQQQRALLQEQQQVPVVVAGAVEREAAVALAEWAVAQAALLALAESSAEAQEEGPGLADVVAEVWEGLASSAVAVEARQGVFAVAAVVVVEASAVASSAAVAWVAWRFGWK